MARNLKVEARLIADTGSYTAGIRKAMADTDRFGRSTKRAGRGDPFRGLAKNALRAAAATASLYTVYDQGKKAVNTTVDLAKSTAQLTRTTGLSTREASRFVAVSKVRGIENTKLAASFTILSKQIAAAQKGTEASVSAFDKLGVSQEAIRAGDTNAVFLQAADGLSKMANGANKTALAAQLFGRGYQALFPLLDMGSKGIAEQTRLAGSLGAELSGNSTKSMLQFVQAQREAKLAQMGLQVQLGQVLIPTLTKGVAALSQFIIQFRQGTGAGGQLRSTLESIRATLAPLARLLAENPRLILAAAAAWVSFKTTVGALRLAETILNVVPTVAQMSSRGRLAGSALSKGFAAGLLVGFVLLQPDLDKAQKRIFNKLKKDVPGFSRMGKDFIDALGNGFNRGAPGIFGIVANAVAGARKVAEASKGNFISDGKAIAQSLGKGIRSAAQSVAGAAKSIAGKAFAAVRGFISQFFGIGQSMGEGLAGGIRSAIGRAVQAAKDIINQAKAAAREAAKSKSPSRVFMAIGEDLVAGMAVGMSRVGAVTAAGRNLARAAATATNVPATNVPLSGFITDPITGGPGLDPQLVQQQRRLAEAQAAVERAKDAAGDKRSKAESARIKRLQAEARSAQRAVDSLERQIGRRDVLLGIRDQFTSFVDQAVQNFRDQLAAPFDEATGTSPEAVRLRELRAEQERLAREREDTAYTASKTDLEAQLAKAVANGNVRSQQELNAQLAALDQERRDTERQREIDALQLSLSAQRDAAQAANNQDVLIFQQGLQDKLNAELASLTQRAQNYAQFAAKVQGILSSYGLSGLFSGSPSDEAALQSPGRASRGSGRGSRGTRRRASGGMLSRAGLTLVGETGPELIDGSNVLSATRTARMSGSGVTLNVYPQTTADDPVALARALGWQLATR